MCHELCTGLGAAFLDVFEAALVEPPLQSRFCVLALWVCEPLSRHHTKDIRYLPLHKTASYAFVSRVSESVFFSLDKLYLAGKIKTRSPLLMFIIFCKTLNT